MTFIGQRMRTIRARMRADAIKGSAAIEFAMVAPVFFALMLGIFEAAIMFFSQAALQNAMSDMGRLIRTGQAANWTCTGTGASQTCTPMTTAQFRTELCARIAPLIACDTNLQIDVKAQTSYGSTITSPLRSDKTLDPSLNRFEIGNACDVVLARAFYTRSVVTPVLNWFLINMAGNKTLITGITAFRNEPFVAGAGGC
jgi:Flp pilus assembly protein TadG